MNLKSIKKRVKYVEKAIFIIVKLRDLLLGSGFNVIVKINMFIDIGCNTWVHRKCDTELDATIFKELSQSNKKYNCLECRKS